MIGKIHATKDGTYINDIIKTETSIIHQKKKFGCEYSFYIRMFQENKKYNNILYVLYVNSIYFNLSGTHIVYSSSLNGKLNSL